MDKIIINENGNKRIIGEKARQLYYFLSSDSEKSILNGVSKGGQYVTYELLGKRRFTIRWIHEPVNKRTEMLYRNLVLITRE
ncbi:MAG: hypothetical protein KKA07_06245 [Bacteroidetes bacterium]|nr:hypothetical protein [Bacteroidota bacterium]MBU1718655.1 hypothetical protein [Bacteroidota bacterium]